MSLRVAPRHLRSDNGSDFISRAILRWLTDEKIEMMLIAPGKPAQSFIVDKLTRKLAPKGEGRPMPLDPQTGNVQDPNPVEGFVWKTLVAWIAQGAANN